MFREWILAHNKSDIDSFTNLKRALGILGIVLPLICILGGYNYLGHPLQNSISRYYHTNMRDVIVGLLGCTSILFMTYSGYGIVDNLVTWLIGLAGAGVVIFPCSPDPPTLARVGILQLAQSTSSTIHFISAGAFFFLLAINSIFLFTLSEKKVPEQKKRMRNSIYFVSGIIILASLATLLIVYLVARRFFENSLIPLIFEAIMLFSFGVAWLVKGGVPMLRD